ncbi:protein scarlet-like [Schistocerca piceifrons]|uniref:protein scarlet-like n=1 Tax=Schistocerca piceifrons TaxID=274613 RepID=UPI001F5EB10C|nr:protein scarlet-like [Schistocerca piceifrons]
MELSMGFNKVSGVTLSWEELSVWVRRRRQKQPFWKGLQYDRVQILNNVSGIAKSGTLLAIMGASGAGKTTLLATISQRIKGETKGDILVNGRPVDQAIMSSISGFVPQQDLTIDSLTVSEHMEFMACMKMDAQVRFLQRQRRISSLISELGLDKCKNTKLSALSGGERKRLSLAVQLLTDPLLLFCDEPTTGLDSYSAGVVVEKLRQFAEMGKAVICTIHQPASGLFDLFNEVLLLAGGRVAFHGDVGEAAKHFKSLGLVCPTTFNKAEFYVSQLAIVPGKEAECSRKIEWLCDEFEKSPYSKYIADQIASSYQNQKYLLPNQELFENKTVSYTNGGLKFYHEQDHEFGNYMSLRKPHHLTQVYWLTRRTFIDLIRHSTDVSIRIGLYMMIALLLALPYVGIKLDQRGIQNVQGLMYLIITETIFTFSYGVFHTFPSEIPILLREISSGLYKPGPYYISKMLILLPRTIIEPFMYTTLIFWIVGLQGGLRGFLVFCVPVILSAISATALGCVMSAAFESVSTASLVSVPIDFLTLTFSGIYLHLGNLPAHLSWIRYTSNFYYGTEAVSILQWEKIHHIPCYEDPKLPCISTGYGVLEKYGYGPNNFDLDLLGLFLIYTLSHVIGFIAICIRSRKEPVY